MKTSSLNKEAEKRFDREFEKLEVRMNNENDEAVGKNENGEIIYYPCYEDITRCVKQFIAQELQLQREEKEAEVCQIVRSIEPYLKNIQKEMERKFVDSILNLKEMHIEGTMGVRTELLSQEGVRNALRTRLKQSIESLTKGQGVK